MTAVAENFDVLQKQLGTTLIASNDIRGAGAGPMKAAPLDCRGDPLLCGDRIAGFESDDPGGRRHVDENLRRRRPNPTICSATTRGTYLEGYGTLFTFEVDLVSTGGLLTSSPFRPTVDPGGARQAARPQTEKAARVEGSHAESHGECQRHAGRACRPTNASPWKRFC